MSSRAPDPTSADRYYVDPAKASRTIFVDGGAARATDFALTADLRRTLIENGQRAAEEYLAAAARR